MNAFDQIIARIESLQTEYLWGRAVDMYSPKITAGHRVLEAL